MSDLFEPDYAPAEFSDDRVYRYALRRGDMTKPVMFLMLNPSTADETADDPTIRRCMGYARAWGYSGLIVGNIFAFRATDPKVMVASENPTGPDNDSWIIRLAREANGNVVCAWGYHGYFRGRGGNVRQLLIRNGIQPTALHITNTGEPGHPLYLSKELVPRVWQ